MKTTILIGYAKTDASGNPVGAAKVISGPPADDAEAREQGRIFSDAKQRHQFPKGVKYIAIGNVEIADVAIHISAEVTDQINGRESQRTLAIEAEEKKRAAAQKRAAAIAEATKAVSASAVAHNTASANLKTAKDRAQDAEANNKLAKTELTAAALKAAQEKVDDLEKVEAEAAKALTEAKAAKAKLNEK
jgi:hypothetical protein